MPSAVPLKLTRLVLAFGCAIMQCSCSRDREVKGEIFIVTAGHESVKLGLVEIGAFQAAQLNGLIESVKKKIAEQEAQLAPISSAANELEASADRQNHDAIDKWIYKPDERFRLISDRASTLSNARAGNYSTTNFRWAIPEVRMRRELSGTYFKPAAIRICS